MKKFQISVLLIFLVIIVNNLIAAPLSLKFLIENKKITCNAVSEGGLTLNLTINNITNEIIEGAILPGDYFFSEDEKAQDVLANYEVPFSIQPMSATTVKFTGNCTERKNYGSYKGTIFNYSTTENLKLKDLAVTCATNEARYGYVRQGLVWNLADKINPIYLDDEFSSKDPLYKCISKYSKVARYPKYAPVKNKPAPAPIPQYTFSSRINITYNLQENQTVSLICTDKNGKVLDEYYKNKLIKKGYYSVTVGYNNIVTDSACKVTFKLINEQGNVLFKKSIKNNTFEEKPEFYTLNTTLEYELKEPIKKASMKLFDENGNLIQTLLKDRDMALGIRKTPLSFFHMSGTNATLTIKIFDDKGKVILEIPVNTKGSVLTK